MFCVARWWNPDMYEFTPKGNTDYFCILAVSGDDVLKSIFCMPKKSLDPILSTQSIQYGVELPTGFTLDEQPTIAAEPIPEEREELPENVTEEDVTETMRVYNMTREQVLARLKVLVEEGMRWNKGWQPKE